MSNVKSIKSPTPLFPEILALHGKWKGKKAAVICDGQVLSWSDLIKRVNSVANGLINLGLQKGDRVVVLMGNGIPMLEVLLGIMHAGCISVPINLSVSDDSAMAMIDDAEPKAIFATEDQLSRFEARKLDTITYILCGEPILGWLDYAIWVSQQSEEFPNINLDDEDLLNIIYSSGTTGLPKGIAHSHKGRRDWAYDLSIALRYHSSARTLIPIGMYSNITWVAMLTTLLAGGTLVILKSFTTKAFWSAVSDLNITHTAMVPVLYQRIADDPNVGGVDTSKVQSLMSCGSPLHESLRKKLFEIFECGIIELYGLTEGIITTLDPEEAEGHWKSAGKPMVGTDIAILDDKDQLADVGSTGEVISRGRISMPFYFNRDDATDEARWIDAEGRHWLRSGDIGFLDDEGYLYIVDRKKDMILSGGQNIYPQDIESQIVQFEGVKDVAVVSAKSERWGETPLALVVKCPATPFDENTLKIWCNERVGKQQRIADVIFVDELPRNPNGKILKRELRQTYADRVYP